MHIADQCAPREIANDAENLVLQALFLPQIPRQDKYKSLQI
jgi:hypothetical protein